METNKKANIKINRPNTLLKDLSSMPTQWPVGISPLDARPQLAAQSRVINS